MNKIAKMLCYCVVFLLVATLLFWWISPLKEPRQDASEQRVAQRAMPVEIAPVKCGPITLSRTFTGTLEPHAQFVVAPKVSGRVEYVAVNISDSVSRGQVVAHLDDDEYVQALAQARADLEVARANQIEAQSALETARRDLKRIRTLRERGVASESQLDAALAEETGREAAVEVARAQVVRAESSVRTAEIRLGYTRVPADWSGGVDQRVVAERYIDEGETVSANTALLRIVELAPILGVVYVTEKDYARLHRDQSVTLTTDVFPDEVFAGRIARIAPIFQTQTRQARVELEIANDEMKLKPGMFIRAAVVLDHRENATLVPEQAVLARDGQTGVFLVDESEQRVAWRAVETGIHAGGRVQIMDSGLSGSVVVLGQQLLVDEAPVLIVNEVQSDLSREQQAPQL